ncbi:hypothetical protein CC1G_04513 [Coprinopsis cinerea okayama7|uniref:BTB domain-containing protein n=1 Tax=Coprinopsis cinerea (strain Okayama-7 / 130 / ATCC MYA-4618 / FGSC 9003) TaxID=240176 RepID=A8N5D5_COPC7|nr:hypothetical protein CC1G_04513 [Coprinopsis cinerea okayama7\|eukprot:XP_001830080.2 hypothetical protein CC1G_04513 [Coprinopsis cinerea okayama7\
MTSTNTNASSASPSYYPPNILQAPYLGPPRMSREDLQGRWGDGMFAPPVPSRRTSGRSKRRSYLPAPHPGERLTGLGNPSQGDVSNTHPATGSGRSQNQGVPTPAQVPAVEPTAHATGNTPGAPKEVTLHLTMPITFPSGIGGPAQVKVPTAVDTSSAVPGPLGPTVIVPPSSDGSGRSNKDWVSVDSVPSAKLSGSNARSVSRSRSSSPATTVSPRSRSPSTPETCDVCPEAAINTVLINSRYDFMGAPNNNLEALANNFGRMSVKDKDNKNVRFSRRRSRNPLPDLPIPQPLFPQSIKGDTRDTNTGPIPVSAPYIPSLASPTQSPWSSNRSLPSPTAVPAPFPRFSPSPPPLIMPPFAPAGYCSKCSVPLAHTGSTVCDACRPWDAMNGYIYPQGRPIAPSGYPPFAPPVAPTGVFAPPAPSLYSYPTRGPSLCSLSGEVIYPYRVFYPGQSGVVHPVYYFSDASLAFVVQGYEFRVHRYLFENGSAVFKKALASFPIERDNIVTISLYTATADAFEAFLKALYARPGENIFENTGDRAEAGSSMTSLQRAQAIFSLATRWEFHTLCKEVMAHYKDVGSLVDRFIVAKKYVKLNPAKEPVVLSTWGGPYSPYIPPANMATPWDPLKDAKKVDDEKPDWEAYLLDVLKGLCLGGNPVTLEDARRLGLETAMKIWHAQDQIRTHFPDVMRPTYRACCGLAKPQNSASDYPHVDTHAMKAIETYIKKKFGIKTCE